MEVVVPVDGNVAFLFRAYSSTILFSVQVGSGGGGGTGVDAKEAELDDDGDGPQIRRSAPLGQVCVCVWVGVLGACDGPQIRRSSPLGQVCVGGCVYVCVCDGPQIRRSSPSGQVGRTHMVTLLV